ncbi:MAG: dephospho-CoA kinase [Alphaproteobacteria bacterium]
MTRRTIILGLTGSIGMGKSTASAMLRRMGLPVHDADAAVHTLFAPGGAAVAPVEAAFPGVVRDGAVDRTELGKRVFGDDAALKRLESIVHPLVRRMDANFRRAMARRRVPVAVLDVPLLFEGGGWRDCDATIVITAPVFLQAARVMARPGMTARRLADIRARQMDDRLKRRLADFVVPSGLGRHTTWMRLRVIVSLIQSGGLRRRRPKPVPEHLLRHA